MLPYFTPIIMLAASNVTLIFAGYGHLKFKTAPILIAAGARFVFKV